MASTTETGHAKNIANLKTLNEINKGFGTTYNPSNPLLKLTAMQTKYTTDNALQNTVNTQSAIFKPKVNARKQEFEPVKPLARRIRSSAKTCGASKEFYTNVNTIIVKILGERASTATATPTDPAGTSASQQSFDNTTNNFNAMVALLKTEPLYAPNEADLKTTTLTTKYNALNTKNNAVKVASVPYHKAIIARNKALYTKTTGLTDVGQTSKDYVKSTFGFSSAEYKLVVKIVFRRLVKVV
jgi:hypothetical protein